MFLAQSKMKNKDSSEGEGEEESGRFQNGFSKLLARLLSERLQKTALLSPGTGHLIFQRGLNEGCHKMGQIRVNEPGKGCYKTF